MTQSRLMSLLEALVNVVVGLVISMVATWAICWYYDIPMTVTHNAILTFWMTVLSIARSYLLRRVFNKQRLQERTMPTPCSQCAREDAIRNKFHEECI